MITFTEHIFLSPCWGSMQICGGSPLGPCSTLGWNEIPCEDVWGGQTCNNPPVNSRWLHLQYNKVCISKTSELVLGEIQCRNARFSCGDWFSVLIIQKVLLEEVDARDWETYRKIQVDLTGWHKAPCSIDLLSNALMIITFDASVCHNKYRKKVQL